MTRRKFHWIAAGLAAAMLLIVVTVPFLVPTGSLKAQIERRVTQQTGRSFHIDGPVSFTLFPDIGLEAKNVHLANVPGGHAPDLVRVARIRVAVGLIALLSGRVEARKIVFEEPSIVLEVSSDGRANWTLPAIRRGTHGEGTGLPANATFAGITIEDGAVAYRNDKTGVQSSIGHLDAKVEFTRFNVPAHASGTFEMRGRTLGYAVDIRTPADLLAGKTTLVDVALTADFLHAGFVGTVTRDGIIDGTSTVHTPSVKDLAGWIGHGVHAGNGLGPLDATAHVVAKDRGVSLDRIVAKLDGMAIGGGLHADLVGKVPIVHGRLAIDRLDLNTYLATEPKPAQPKSLAAPSTGWSRAPLKLDLLKLANGDLTLDVAALNVMHLKLGKTTIAVTLANGAMTARLDPMTLYGGSGTAELAIDAHGPAPAIVNKVAFRGIAMRPFLADTIGNDRIDGTGTITLDIAAKGATPDAVMHSLSGKGAVSIGSGHVRGVDLGAVARTITSILSAGATGDDATTAFDRFSGSFAIAGGVLTNDDLKLTSSFINMNGRGRLNIGGRGIDYRIEPKASVAGMLDIGVPFNITGTWDHVHYRPDLAAAITGLVGSVLRTGSSPVQGIVNGLTGDKKQQSDQPDGKKKKHKNLGDALKNMFGIH